MRATVLENKTGSHLSKTFNTPKYISEVDFLNLQEHIKTLGTVWVIIILIIDPTPSFLYFWGDKWAVNDSDLLPWISKLQVYDNCPISEAEFYANMFKISKSDSILVPDYLVLYSPSGFQTVYQYMCKCGFYASEKCGSFFTFFLSIKVIYIWVQPII